MTTTVDHAPTGTRPARGGDHVVLIARIGTDRVRLTAAQVIDIVAAYLASGRRMPTPTPGPRDDPYAGLHVLTEEALWGATTVWVDRAAPAQLATYRHRATRWARAYFGATFPSALDTDTRPVLDDAAAGLVAA